jgi:hypothetical protein
MNITSTVAHFDQDNWKEHGRLGARIVRPFLVELGYGPEDTEAGSRRIMS